MTISRRCCACKKVRDADGNYVEPDQLILPRDVAYSDGFCPPCFRAAYPDYAHLAGDEGEREVAHDGR